MQNLDQPSLIAKECHRLGMIHRKGKRIGVKSDHWDLWGEAVTETIREYQVKHIIQRRVSRDGEDIVKVYEQLINLCLFL